LAPIYSVLFGHLEALPGGVDVFTVPPGHVYVLRDVDVYQDQPFGAAIVRMSANPPGTFWWAAGMPVTRYAGLPWRGRQVFEAGETLTIYADLPTTIFRLSGYDLSGP
jgi:hypothetical protein